MSEDEARRPLRKGWTTGTCAAAAAAAAYHALLTGTFPDPVTVALPRGGSATLPLSRAHLRNGEATAGIVKDAGDDPDVTHGAEVVAAVAAAPPGSGVAFRAGEGIGTVTRPGLPLPPGEPAINPAPREMIRRAIAEIAACCSGSGDVLVTLSIPGGEALAAKTLNGRLGIKGGLSILGTTGIVVPFSCSAWIHSIYRGIDVARAAGLNHLAAATGSTSEAAVQRLYDLPEPALIDMGDFVGGTLKYLRAHPVPKLTLAGGFGKLVKLAQGHLFLHSSKSRVDMGALAASLAALGAPSETVAAARAANTAAQVLSIAEANGLPLADDIAQRARAVALEALAGDTAVEVLVFDRAGRLIGRAAFNG
jgi:cobalt-precorrin-5B (C1)-methyltransferase